MKLFLHKLSNVWVTIGNVRWIACRCEECKGVGAACRAQVQQLYGLLDRESRWKEKTTLQQPWWNFPHHTKLMIPECE